MAARQRKPDALVADGHLPEQVAPTPWPVAEPFLQLFDTVVHVGGGHALDLPRRIGGGAGPRGVARQQEFPAHRDDARRALGQPGPEARRPVGPRHDLDQSFEEQFDRPQLGVGRGPRRRQVDRQFAHGDAQRGITFVQLRSQLAQALDLRVEFGCLLHQVLRRRQLLVLNRLLRQVDEVFRLLAQVRPGRLRDRVAGVTVENVADLPARVMQPRGCVRRLVQRLQDQIAQVGADAHLVAFAGVVLHLKPAREVGGLVPGLGLTRHAELAQEDAEQLTAQAVGNLLPLGTAAPCRAVEAERRREQLFGRRQPLLPEHVLLVRQDLGRGVTTSLLVMPYFLDGGRGDGSRFARLPVRLEGRDLEAALDVLAPVADVLVERPDELLAFAAAEHHHVVRDLQLVVDPAEVDRLGIAGRALEIGGRAREQAVAFVDDVRLPDAQHRLAGLERLVLFLHAHALVRFLVLDLFVIATRQRRDGHGQERDQREPAKAACIRHESTPVR